MQEEDNYKKTNVEKAIVNFITDTFDKYRYSVQDLSESIAKIEDFLQQCNCDERYELLNSKYIDGPDRSYAVSSLIRICIVRIHNQCEIKPHTSAIKTKIQILCQFSCRLIQLGLNPMLPFWQDFDSGCKVRIFNGFHQVDSWSYSIFSKLAESIEFSSDVNMTDIYSLVFDIITTFKGDKHYPNLSRKVKPAILTLPIWKEDDSFDVSAVRRRIFSGLHDIWICGSAFLSMYGGYSPTRGDFTPSVLQLALDKLSKYADQKLFTFINMDTQNTSSDYHRLLPMTYDHQFVLETKMNKSDAINTLKKVLYFAYDDIIVHSDGYYSHYSIIVYIYLIAEFYKKYMENFYNKFKVMYEKNEKTIPLIYDIIQRNIINDYYFEDLSFVDTELDHGKVISIFLSQINKFSKEWQDWIELNLIPKYSQTDLIIFKHLLFAYPGIAQYVVTSYKNHNLTKFILSIYDGHLNFQQMIDILCNNEIDRVDILKQTLNEKRIDFNDRNVDNLFKYVMISLILKSNYVLNESLMDYIFDLYEIFREKNNTIELITNSLQQQFSTLCQFPSRSNEIIVTNNIYQFLKALKRNHNVFKIDFNIGFIECINYQNQHVPNMVVLKYLFDLNLLDYGVCQQRLYLQKSILADNPEIISLINQSWPWHQNK